MMLQLLESGALLLLMFTLMLLLLRHDHDLLEGVEAIVRLLLLRHVLLLWHLLLLRLLLLATGLPVVDPKIADVIAEVSNDAPVQVSWKKGKMSQLKPAKMI